MYSLFVLRNKETGETDIGLGMAPADLLYLVEAKRLEDVDLLARMPLGDEVGEDNEDALCGSGLHEFTASDFIDRIVDLFKVGSETHYALAPFQAIARIAYRLGQEHPLTNSQE